MRRTEGWRVLWASLALVNIGCVNVGCATTSEVGRLGLAFPLSTGDPQSRCELHAWRELVPASTQSIAVSGSSEVTQGVGVFALGDDAPEDLDDLWEGMNERDLQRAHQARIEPVDQALRESLYWSLTGIAGMAGGVTMAAVAGDNQPVVLTALGTGLVIGIVSIVGALSSIPTSEDQHEADARRRLLIPGEDDMQAAERGVVRLNTRVRESCAVHER